MVFWDMIAGVYDLFEKLYNGRCYDGTGARVAQEINKNDIVLECACGTGSISKLRSKDNRFDKVIAGNVIHLLDEPYKAADELLRVCKPGGKVIIPTYIDAGKSSSELLVKIFDFAGAHFTNQFDRESYKDFFVRGGYDAEIDIVDGQMPCAIAVITKK